MKAVSQDEAGKAIITMLRLSELYGQWHLWRALVRYIGDAGGSLTYLGPQQYLLQHNDIDSKEHP